MNGKNGGKSRVSQTGTHHAEYMASPTTGHRNNPRFREKTMTYTATNFRSAFFAVSFALLGSVLLLVGTVSAPLVA